MNTNESPTWQCARELAGQCSANPTTHERFHRQIGKLWAYQDMCSIRFGKAFSHHVVDSMLSYQLGSRLLTNEEFRTLTSWGNASNHHTSWKLNATSIEQIIGDCMSKNYPKFNLRWKMDERTPSKGILEFLRIDLSGSTFINYYTDGNNLTFKQGDSDLFKGLPENVTESMTIAGRHIAFEIDFEAEAQKILERSTLREFALACTSSALATT